MPTLGLAMIVKNGAARLRECLATIAGVVDQIVIADTGSSDGSQELARSLGAKVVESPWQDDFAHARNSALRELSTDWVLVLDDDEQLDGQAREKIPALLSSQTVGGYSVILRNYLPVRFGSGGYAPVVISMDSAASQTGKARAYTDFALCRLFRRDPEIYYVGRVHELVEPRIRKLGMQIATSDLLINHFGHLSSPEQLRSKDEFYRKLGRLKLIDQPNDPQAWIEMGLQEYEQFKNYSRGIECFKKALALDPNYSTIPYLSLASLYLEIHGEKLALELLSRIVLTGRANGVKEDIRGDAFYNLGQLKEARSAYMRAASILSNDTRIASKLGLVEIRLGMKKNGLARIARSLKATPEICEIHDRMIKAFILTDSLPQAAEAAERLALGLPNPITILRAAGIRGQMKEWKAAEDLVVRGLQQFPQSRELLRAKAELAQQTKAVAAS